MIKRVLNKWDFVKQKPKSLLNISYVNPEFTLGTDINYQFLAGTNNTLDFDESTNERIRELVREEILRIIGTTENI
jgi:hypothetical protein